MTAVTAELIKQLRSRTNSGLADCKRVLIEAGGNFELAIEYLARDARAREVEIAENRASVDALLSSTETLESVVDDHVRMGFYEEARICSMVGDYLGLEDRGAIELAIERSIAAKRVEADSWRDETDCDRLDRAFAAIARRQIVALQNAGVASSDGHECVDEEIQARHGGTERLLGYCFFHFQDLMLAIRGRGLMLAFGSFDDERTSNLAVGRIVRREIETTGLKVDWPEAVHERLLLPTIEWRRRGPELGIGLRTESGARAEYFCR